DAALNLQFNALRKISSAGSSNGLRTTCHRRQAKRKVAVRAIGGAGAVHQLRAESDIGNFVRNTKTVAVVRPVQTQTCVHQYGNRCADHWADIGQLGTLVVELSTKPPPSRCRLPLPTWKL